MKNIIITILFLSCLGLTFWCVRLYRNSVIKKEVVILLPNQGQLQQILNALDPNDKLKVDYFVGGKTRDKWDYIVCNEYAAVFMTADGSPRKGK